jgi:hypothetical protein
MNWVGSEPIVRDSRGRSINGMSSVDHARSPDLRFGFVIYGYVPGEHRMVIILGLISAH